MDLRSGIEHAVAELEPGGRLVGLRELAGGVSADVFGLDIATAAGGRRRVVYRRHRSPDFKQHVQRVTAKEYGLLAALHRRGLAVPEPYLCDDTDVVTAPYMVIEWIDGSTEVAVGDLPRALDQLAQFLVGLHSLDPSSLQLPELEPIEDPRTAIVPYLPPTGAGERVRAALTSGALSPDLIPPFCCTATTGRATSCGTTPASSRSSTGRMRASAIRWRTWRLLAWSCCVSTGKMPWPTSAPATSP